MAIEKAKTYSESASHVIEVLQGKWRMQILWVMRAGPTRLGQLARRIPCASKKVLTENLRELEANGIVVRRDLSGNVRHVEYDFNEGLRPAVNAILDHLAEVGGQLQPESVPPQRRKCEREGTAT
jgi:DNA-binding HxlR family transcriptional regulator